MQSERCASGSWVNAGTPDALAAVIDVIDRHRPSLDRQSRADAFLHDLFAVTPKVEVELADGRVLEIRPRRDGDPA
jgi:hypothetical protein